jgi:hypothetical protein
VSHQGHPSVTPFLLGYKTTALETAYKFYMILTHAPQYPNLWPYLLSSFEYVLFKGDWSLSNTLGHSGQVALLQIS